MTTQEPDVVVGDPTPEEMAKRGESAFLTALEGMRQRDREERDAELLKAIELLDAPDRKNVPEIYKNPAEHKDVTRFSSPTEPLYRGMSADVREWRNPDSDFWMAEWIRGNYASDSSKMMLAKAKLGRIFPRTVMTEDDAGAEGAFSSTGTGTELIPRPLEALVYIARDRVAKMRRFATIYQMTAQQHNIPTADAMTAAMVDEATGAGQSEPAIDQVPLVARVGGVQARATRELIADSAVNLVTILTQRGGAALGVLEDNEFFKAGTGTAPHITKLSGTAYSEISSAELKYSDVVAMYHTVGQQYRDNAVWFIGSEVLGWMSNVRDGMGNPYYQGLGDTPGPITDDPGAVGTIMRKPVYEVPLTSGDVWFGDPSQYAIGDRQGIEIAVSEHARFLQREVVWMITERFAGNNTDTAAAQLCAGITSATSL